MRTIYKVEDKCEMFPNYSPQQQPCPPNGTNGGCGGLVVLVVVMVMMVMMVMMVITTHHDNSHARPTEPLELFLEENYGEQAHEDHDGTFYQEDKKEKSLLATKLI